ncbi:MAG TPA: VOC family protein [Aliidongia sp.]|uniref:VOC family protein n=1 Tax=Aliidongia sp. TaxID=1914230 RepID=UPI002DDD3296|nr:VOC family protein [Aliidongia sp.]HEV2675479.1 VOC family protein [Aliidongia sp.]
MSDVRPVPEGMHTVTPHLVCANAVDAIAYYEKALGAVEVGRLAGPDGKIAHAALRIGDSTVFLTDEMPQCGLLGPTARNGSSVTIHLSVDNADAVLARAVAAGAEVAMPIWDAPWGDRYGQFRDPFGHSWAVATHVRDVTPEQIREAVHAMCG